MSVLFTGSTTQQLANTVNKPPQSFCLGFIRPTYVCIMFLLYRIYVPMMEEIGTAIPEY